MANTTLPGTGDVIGADEISGVKYQRVKLVHGAEGFAVDASETDPLPVFDDANNGLLRRILLMLMAPLGYDKSSQRQRVTANIENLPTLATVTTVGTVSNLNGINGRNSDMMLNANINAAWALNVRARIT